MESIQTGTRETKKPMTDILDKIKEQQEQESSDALETIRGYGEILKKLQQEIQEHEDTIKALKQEQKRIAEQRLPDIMDDAGISEMVLSDGSKIECRDYVYARIKDADTAFAYLAEKNEDGIIDNQVIVKLPKGMEAIASTLMAKLQEEGLGQFSENKKTIHFKRLESWVREALENPEFSDLPKSAFGVYEGRKVSFK